MRIVHWSDKTLASGLGETANHICEAERKLGLDSVVVDPYKEDEWHNADDADVHVVHLFMPPKYIYGSKKPKVWVAHGTPEVMWESGFEESCKGQYGHADGWMIAQYWLQHADVTVTFWPRHEAIWKSLSDKNTRIEGVPLGVGDFWHPVKTQGKFAGEPSMFTAENCYYIKRPLDLFFSWRWVIESGLYDAKLHAVNIPYDQNRFWFTLANRNSSAFHSYITNRRFNSEELRNAFCSTDFYANLVRYSDHNYIGLQASACGAKVISYKGNPYADYWVDFGDQRYLAQQLSAILKNQVEPRKDKEKPVSLLRTAERMIEIYKSLGVDHPTGLMEIKQPKRKRKARVIPDGTSLATATIQ